MTPAEALAKLEAEAIPGDPLARVQALEGKSDRIPAAARLLRDWSFAAALREADLATFDLVAAELHRLVKITKVALEEAIERFGQQLRPAADPKGSTAPATHPPELIKKAEELLRDPKLLDRFHAGLARDGVVGERKAATTILLAAVTRKTKRPVHLVLKAASSSGKNHVVKHVVARLPAEDVLEITDMSPRALQYLPGSLRGKVVVIAEHEGAERAEYSLRIVMSEGSLSILTAEKVSDDQGSRIETREHKVEGPACFITTTTRPLLNDENETRVLEVTLDETSEQTRRIIDAHALRVQQPPSLQDEEQAAAERDVWQCALGLLDATQTINPFASKLAARFPVARVRARRDFPRLLDLTAAHALLHQRQRQRGPDGRVILQREDVVAAWKLCQALLSDVSLRLRAVATKLWAKFATEEFTPAEASRVLGDSLDDARRLLRDMGNAELVECVQEHKGSMPSRWKLAGEPDCPTEPDFEPCRTNSAETTRETTEPGSPTSNVGGVNGAGTDRPGAGDQPVDQQSAKDPGRTVGQTDFCNDSARVTPTEAKVGQSRAVGRSGNGAADREQTTNGAAKVLPRKLVIDVLPGETEEQAEARTGSNARCAECGRTDVGVSVVLDDDSRVCHRCWSGVRNPADDRAADGEHRTAP
jgi:hypothetical protein